MEELQEGTKIKVIVGVDRAGKRKYESGVIVKKDVGCYEVESGGKYLRLYPSEFYVVKKKRDGNKVPQVGQG